MTTPVAPDAASDGTESSPLLDDGTAALARWVLAPLALGAGAIHVSMVADHAQVWRAEGLAFAVVAWLQIGLALLLVVRPSRRAIAAVAALSLACVGAWAWTRWVGFPMGPSAGSTEDVGSVDLLCAALESTAAVVAAAVLARPPKRAPRGVPALLGAIVPTFVVLALTTAVLASPAGTHSHGDEAASGHAQGEEAEAHEDADHVDRTEHAHEDDIAVASAETGETSEAATSHDHGAECTAPVTDEQQAAADELVAVSREAMGGYDDFDAATAAGYVNITPEGQRLVHYARYDLVQDDAVLDPDAIESLMYFHPADGGEPVLVGAMYFADPGEAGPQVGGCLTQWHVHDNLCIAPGEGMVGVVDAEGRCPDGSSNDVTQEMLHVWDLDLPTGPFSDLAETDRTALAAAVIEKVAAGGTA